jgi:ribosome-binding protein aMBF1 (putative translation factor)
MNSTNKNSDRLKEILKFRTEDDKIDFLTEALHLDIIAEVENLMEKREISRAELAKKLNTSKSYITQLFTGDKLLNLKTIVKLGKILNANVKFEFMDYEKKTVNYRKVN